MRRLRGLQMISSFVVRLDRGAMPAFCGVAFVDNARLRQAFLLGDNVSVVFEMLESASALAFSILRVRSKQLCVDLV